MAAEAVLATYRIRAPRGEAERLARWIALEETVEVPPEVARAHPGAAALVGEVREVREAAPGVHKAVLAYRPELARGGLPQLLNLLCGNVTWLRNVRLEAVALPPEVLAAYPGPRYGVPGLRALLGVEGRPLVCTALKPRGSTTAELASLARAFAAGGGDIVKDDHNLVDEGLEAFRRRTEACQAAVAGTGCLYFPSLSLRRELLEGALDHLEEIRVRGVLLPPLLLGLDVVRELSRRRAFVVMAHPTFLGSFLAHPDHGVAPGLLMGTFLRLAGCDAVVFPHAGGRFPLETFVGAEIAAACRRPLGALRPAFPVPAGGLGLENVAAVVGTFGVDTILLVGGALLTHAGGVRAATAELRERVAAALPSGGGEEASPLGPRPTSAPAPPGGSPPRGPSRRPGGRSPGCGPPAG